MATLPELARMHTRLDEDELSHLTRLVASWGMLADLCFGDLLLLVVVSDGDDNRFIVLGQMRPTTSQTLHREDLVGRIIDAAERPLVASAWRSGEILDGEMMLGRGERARIQCIPVRHKGKLVGVLTRESALAVGRRPGELERAYVEVFDRFARMVVRGEFPYPVDEGITAESPRVGDGALLLDAAGLAVYASPNAVNALHRMGVYSNAEGVRLDEVGVDETAVSTAYTTHLPVTEEVERRPDVIILIRALPILENGKVTGGIVLLRDVTDLRRRDRLLLSKDATIREVHHRVKNNLQTIGSLLRLQARRLAPGEGREALDEAERRIRSIALVHEILSRDAGEQVAFNEIIGPLVRMAADGLIVTETPVEFSWGGEPGALPAALATPLAVVLTELLQNAAEHAFVDGSRPQSGDGVGWVEVQLANDGSDLVVTVRDNGQGLPSGFTIGSTRSLGLSIVRDLVTSQLGGTIDLHTDGGTVVVLTIPIPPSEP
jgi:two-component sensor histidine kinase